MCRKAYGFESRPGYQFCFVTAPPKEVYLDTPLLTPPVVTVTGEVHRVRYENPDTGFAVLVLVDSEGKKFVACGALAGNAPGKTLELSGHFENDAEYGRELKADSAREVLPRTNDGIARFLCGSVPGIGPKTADLIVKYFGADTLAILDKSPRRLIEVPGIGPRRAADLAAAWKQNSDRRDELIFLQGLGVTPAYCRRLFARYGENAAEVVRGNPYRLAEEVDGSNRHVAMFIHSDCKRWMFTVKPAIDKFILDAAMAEGVDLQAAGYDSTLEGFKRETKRIQAATDPKLRRLFDQIAGYPELQRLRNTLKYLMHKQYDADPMTAQAYFDGTLGTEDLKQLFQ